MCMLQISLDPLIQHIRVDPRSTHSTYKGGFGGERLRTDWP